MFAVRTLAHYEPNRYERPIHYRPTTPRRLLVPGNSPGLTTSRTPGLSGAESVVSRPQKIGLTGKRVSKIQSPENSVSIKTTHFLGLPFTFQRFRPSLQSTASSILSLNKSKTAIEASAIHRTDLKALSSSRKRCPKASRDTDDGLFGDSF